MKKTIKINIDLLDYLFDVLEAEKQRLKDDFDNEETEKEEYLTQLNLINEFIKDNKK